MFDWLLEYIPNFISIAVVVVLLIVIRLVLNRKYADKPGHQFKRDLIILLSSLVGIVVLIISLPVSETTVGQLLSLLGILVSAAIALSATTFIGNIMAGMMLRVIKNFKIGDFVRIGEYFGRISERGLFHIEIQNEDRDLTTLPNMYLVTNPVKVIRASGTIIHAEVSLGYDISFNKIKELLKQAANSAELTDPFVHILDLGDYSITYRVGGLLEDVKSVLSKRSQLRERMLETLHTAGVEIVSPTFMNQRVFDTKKQFIPKREHIKQSSEDELVEDLVFDKAEEAESQARLIEKQEELEKDIKALQDQAAKEPDNAEVFNRQVNMLERHLEMVKRRIKKNQDKEKD